ncbi:MAG TPA: thiamine pyrophosphate-dependent enzyme [Jatrophihabitans sp.]|uniref:thiamine pyrophosphate-dependent enzyme n=1 Tax=Jatrophihabitans sp. TaxID=1932789 RepID=UPI002E0331D1|nr:thiamine pyrophosphate-dependent enzyme [Jatrophihabitans sp.]
MTSPGTASQHDDLDRHVRDTLRELDAAASVGEADPGLLTLFDAMVGSRLLDIHARHMRDHGRGFYTIGSAGHESNAYVAEALRPSDPALLHYRSGGFFVARSMQAGRALDDALRAVLLSMLASTADPASGGRHKVFGDASLAVLPQTSTIASHLPRALGVALSLSRAKRLGVAARWAKDSVVVCSFGDASLNHSTAAGALNAAGYTSSQGLPLPLVFVCEDNGIGISVPTLGGWVAAAARRPGIGYVAADGADPDAARAAAAEVVDTARRTRTPMLLHLRTVRFLGHAGSDVEAAYRPAAAIAADRARDPLLALARRIGTPGLAARYDDIAERVGALAHELASTPTLQTAAAVMAPLAPRASGSMVDAALAPATAERRTEVFGTRLPEDGEGLTLAQSINAGLTDALASRSEMLVFGEDVGRKGGVYGVTRGLAQRFGAARVFDSLLDEQSILGLGLGLGVSGLLPVPEIQYLAYLHNAEDQLRGEAASLRFFSGGTFTNPMVVRIAGLAYQKGFGGHFHNDNAVGVLRDIPGLVVAVPSRPEDAAPMLRACLGAAAVQGQVSVFLEPIALYHEKDLHEPGDRGWLGAYSPTTRIPIGSARVHGTGSDLTIVTFGNGVRMSLRVAKRLADHGFGVRVLDLRWLAPLPMEDILLAAAATRRVLVVDETRHSGGVGEGVLAGLVEARYPGRMARVASKDSFIPLGDAANLVLLGEDEIESAAHALLGR